MLGLHWRTEIPESEAEGDVARVYHEVKQKLRVTGVSLLFRSWASFDVFFPRMWDAIRPNVGTRAFEDAADGLRAQAARAAEALGRAPTEATLGEAQAHRLTGLLDLYHYVNPKLLLVVAATRLALGGRLFHAVAPDLDGIELIEHGAPTGMLAMDMAPERPDDERARELLADVRRSLGLARASDGYRSLALFPAYFEAAWRTLKPVATGRAHRVAAAALREEARRLALALPHPVPLSRQRLADLGEDLRAVERSVDELEALLPGLILNVALLLGDWRPSGEELARSPFPAATRPQRPAVLFGAGA